MIGALLIDKPEGPTSHDVVRRVRKAVGTKSVGHTGTLDPFASGLLVVLVGRATRLARFVEQQDKTYRATLRLGIETDTEDRTGTVTRTHDVSSWPTREQVTRALDAMQGEQWQQPPAYSARKVDGERSYRLARRGEAVALAPSRINVREIALLGLEPPFLEFRVTASAGTYVRSLGRDLGIALGTGGHLVALRREAIGSIRVEDAIPLEAVEPGVPLADPLSVLGHLPVRELEADEAAAVRHGRTVEGGGAGDVALLDRGVLLAIARSEDGRLQPSVVLAGT